MIARNISFKERTIFGRTLFYDIVHLHYSYKRTKKLRVRGKQRTNIPLLLIINLNIVKLKDSKMKKVFTLCVAIMASVATFAQTTLWDGEDKELGTRGGFWNDGDPEVVANPETDGINTSKNCLKFVMTQDKKIVKLPIKASLQGSKRVSLMIRKSQAENIMIELSDPTDGSDGYWKKVATWYGGNDEWQKVVFDFSDNGDFNNPGLIAITAQTGNVEGQQEVYIDDIVIEPAPKVNGTLLSAIGDKSLKEDLNLKGAWMKGECQNADSDPWSKVEYNDFTTLAGKLSDEPANLSNIDMRDCIVKDADINAMRGKHSYIIVYADEAYVANNVVNNGKCKNLVLDESKPFKVKDSFTAETVTLNRSIEPGYKTMCLPFAVSKEDMKAESIATFKDIANDKSVVTFVKVDHVEANVPFIANYNEAVTEFTFANKRVAKTEDLGTTFIGTYTPGYMEGKYGLTTDNTFKKGGAGAKTKAFRAYLVLPEGSEAKTLSLDFTDGESTGIEDATVSFGNKGVKVYSLQGNLIATASSMSELHLSNGIYIINNKKVIIK